MSNFPFLGPESFQRIEDMTVDLLQQLEDDMVEGLINSKGLTYGDIDLPLEERVLKFVDDEARGVNAWVAQNEPEEHARRVREFAAAVQRSGLI